DSMVEAGDDDHLRSGHAERHGLEGAGELLIVFEQRAHPAGHGHPVFLPGRASGRCPLFGGRRPQYCIKWTLSTILFVMATDGLAEATSEANGRRPRGAVRDGLVAAGLEQARTGGPGAVVLREAARMVGVVPNAAYRHFADRDELLAAVCAQAMGELAARMAADVARV